MAAEARALKSLPESTLRELGLAQELVASGDASAELTKKVKQEDTSKSEEQKKQESEAEVARKLEGLSEQEKSMIVDLQLSKRD